MRGKVSIMVLSAVLVLGFFDSGCSEDDSPTEPDIVSSLSYRGHENDADANNLVAGYPAIVGTRLDDCQTCHTGGEVLYDDDKSAVLNPCSYCHLIPYPDGAIVSGAPSAMAATLNPYGLAYKQNGRNRAALQSIDALDSDGDGFANGVELADKRYPGDPASKPGQTLAPAATMTWEEMQNLPAHSQFLLMNSHKQQFDDYAAYVGATLKSVLAAAGADSSATGITIIAPDGYMKDFQLDLVNGEFPQGLFYEALDPGSFSDPAQGFVNYPPAEHWPEGLTDGGAIPGEQWMMMAYGRDGLDLEKSYLDHVSGRLNGEGPYRLVVPQSTPGSPDRGSSYPTEYDDGWDYDPAKDHNAGLCVRGVVAIRVNPMPAGYEEFDWKNGGWALVEKRQLLIYGAGVIGE